MPPVTFGDFLGQAEEHLQAAIASLGRTDLKQAGESGELRRVVTALGRYLDDLVPADVIEAMGRTDLKPWDRASIDVRAALAEADACLSQVPAFAGRPGINSTAQSLAAAAASLTAGRDLLHTHLATTPDDLKTWQSEWAPVLTSPSATRTLTAQVGRWARRLAPLAATLAFTGPPPAATVMRDALQTTAQWLDAANAATRPAQHADPVTADDLRLLHAIPAAQPSPRLPPQDGETIADLCAGITVSAQRLRAAVFHLADHSRGTPTVGADAWQWAARAAAITGHASQLVLRALANYPSTGDLALDRLRLHTTIDAITQSWQAWRQVSVTWNDLTTEPRIHRPPTAIELGDLMLRMGRLAHADSRWTPARTRDSQPRDLASLVASSQDVVAAVHEAADALARLGTADLQAVTLASRGRRLYVATRTLPARYDVPRPYAPAPPDRPKPLLEAYRAARDASLHAADELATLALAIDAPSSTLALARAAVRPTPGRRPGGQARPPVGIAHDLQPDTTAVTPGPVERAVRSLHVSDSVVLLRAAAIDTAAHTLISQAERMTGERPRSPGSGSAIPDGSASGDAARLAAQDHPLFKGTSHRLTGAEIGNRPSVLSHGHEARRTARTPRS